MKPVVFLGNALDELRTFPTDARRRAGFQIDRLQRGFDPDDWKPVTTIGPGIREIRLRDRSGIYRVVYLATLPDAIYILHAFQKKTRATSPADVDLAAA